MTFQYFFIEIFYFQMAQIKGRKIQMEVTKCRSIVCISQKYLENKCNLDVRSLILIVVSQ